MSRYAENTSVSSERSRAEIEQTVSRYGASGFMYGWDDGTAVMAFQMNGRRIRFDLTMPDRNSREFTQTETGRDRAPGITEFEEEFLAHIVLPNGGTVGRWMLPQVKSAYDTGDMPPLLPAPGGGQ